MQVVVRALDVLKAVATAESPLSLAEISTILELPAPTVHRFLAVLVNENYVVKDDSTRRYTSGPQLEAITRRNMLARVARVAEPVLAELHARFDETVFLAQKEGNNAVVTSAHVSTRPLRLTVRPGQVLPWHAAASARSLLAHLPDADVDRLLDDTAFNRFTYRTPQTAGEVRAHLENVRMQGYDICDDELDSGVWAAASPILDPAGTALGSVAVGGPGDRFDESARDDVLGAVRRAARTITDGLTYL